MSENLSTTMTDEELAELKVRSFTLPLNDLALLVPTTVVAEVLDYRESEPAPHMPEWLLGMLSWRGQNVPLFCFETLLGQEPSARREGTRYVICNTLNGSNRIPFVGIQIEGMPQLRMVTNDMLTMDSESADKLPAVQAYLRLQGERVILPDFNEIEKMLESLGISAD